MGKSITLSLRQLNRKREALRIVDEPNDGLLPTRPKQRADCESAPRPCPFVSCKYHLYIDVTPIGSIRLNFPDRELDELEDTCALDVAEHGGVVLDVVAGHLNINRERARQIEAQAINKLRERNSDNNE